MNGPRGHEGLRQPLEDWVALAIESRPDVMLMDIRMLRLDRIEATRRIVADPRCRGTRVIVLAEVLALRQKHTHRSRAWAG